MGGRLSSPPSSTASSAATAHRNPTTGSTTNLSHSRTHANNSGHRRHSTQNRHRSNDISSTTNHFNLNLLHHLGLDHESDEPSTEDDSPQTRRHIPRIFIALRDISCPVCHKTIPSDSFDKHILQCLAKPRVDYNEDTLTEDKGECVICLDDLLVGQKIARLPCLCIYHKSCIDNWFRINRTCPEHPGD